MAGRTGGKYSEQLQTLSIMEKRLILIGGGGHCKSCIDVIEAEGKYIIEGILDAEDKVGTSVLNYPVVGTDENLDEYIQKGYFFLITVGQIKSAHIRKRLYHLLVEKKSSSRYCYFPHCISIPLCRYWRRDNSDAPCKCKCRCHYR